MSLTIAAMALLEDVANGDRQDSDQIQISFIAICVTTHRNLLQKYPVSIHYWPLMTTGS